MGSKTNVNTRSDDRESARRELAAACQNHGSVDYLFSDVIEIILKYLADSASIDLVEDDGSITRALTRHVDLQKQEILINQRNIHPLPATASYGYPRVIKTGKAQFIPGVSERVGNRLFPNEEPEAQLVLDGLGVRSFICVPLIARGLTLGALTVLTTGKSRLLDSDDLLLIEEMAVLIAESLDRRARSK
ncbi:MAG TPA: GAF domain-containing protein [Candidatus Kapabacteria bacterium]|nr:GAF domain-containing protein [Candidatus Kapabacteria bacterium]